MGSEKKPRRRFEPVSRGQVNPFEDTFSESEDVDTDRLETDDVKHLETEKTALVHEDASLVPICPGIEPFESDELEVMSDASVCRALGLRRRELVLARKDGIRGEDWDFKGEEIGMTRRWCRAQKLNMARICVADSGRTSFEAIGATRNPRLVFARRLSDGTVFPVMVGDATRFRAGIIFEAVRERDRYTLSGDAWRIW